MSEQPPSNQNRSGAVDSTRCPFCGSVDVHLEARKGSSICRMLYHCDDCGQPFERFG